MTHKNYKFVECPLVFDLADGKRFNSVAVDIEATFGINKDYSRPFLIKYLTCYADDVVGAYSFSSTSISAGDHLNTILIIDNEKDSKKDRRLFDKVVALYQKNPVVEVMLLNEKDLENFFHNFITEKKNNY